MNQVHVLVNYECGCEVLGAFTDKTLVEEYVGCLCEDKCERCESFEALGKNCPYHDLDSWTVALDDPSFTQQLKASPKNSSLNQVHVVSNEFGEILGALSDKFLLPEDQCPHCGSYESWGEVCPDRRVSIDTVALDNPTLIHHFKERIAQVHAQIRVEQAGGTGPGLSI